MAKLWWLLISNTIFGEEKSVVHFYINSSGASNVHLVMYCYMVSTWAMKENLSVKSAIMKSMVSNVPIVGDSSLAKSYKYDQQLFL